MKGLTPREYVELQDFLGPDWLTLDVRDDESEEVLNGLVEQGRVSVRFEETPDDPRNMGVYVWKITQQGREALELFVRIQSAQRSGT